MNSQAARIIADLERHKTFADLTSDGLGDQLIDCAVMGVSECIAGEHDTEGNPWPELSEKYAEWKEWHYPGQQMGVLHFVMARIEEIRGTVYMSTDEARVTYGVSQQARDEFAWFNEGDPAKNRPPRPCWGLTKGSIDASTQILDDRFKRIV